MTNYLTMDQKDIDKINNRINKNISKTSWINVNCMRHRVYRNRDSDIFYHLYGNIVYIVPHEFWAINEHS